MSARTFSVVLILLRAMYSTIVPSSRVAVA